MGVPTAVKAIPTSSSPNPATWLTRKDQGSSWSEIRDSGSYHGLVAEGVQPSAVDLTRYLSVLRHRWATIMLVTLATVVVTVVASNAQTPVYRASAEILLHSDSPDAVFGSGNGGVSNRVGAVETEIRVLGSDPVREAARAKLGFASDVSAERVGESEVMRVSASSTDRHRAAAIANAYASSYVEFRRTQAVSELFAAGREIEQKVGALDRQIEELTQRATTASPAERATVDLTVRPQLDNLHDQRGELRKRRDELSVEAALREGDAEVVRSAVVPSSPTSPQPLRNGLAALAVGLAVGVALAFYRDRIDDTLRTRSDLDDASGDLPVLGTIPTVPKWRIEDGRPDIEGIREGHAVSGEAYRSLRTAVQLIGVDRPLRVIEITSPMPSEGKTVTAVNLGMMMALGGHSVVLVDADLRNPAVHNIFAVPLGPGLTTVLSGEVTLADAIRPVSDETPMSLLTAGSPAPNAAELVGSKRMAKLLFELQEVFDVVLIDAAPVLPVTDSTLLAVWADTVLLVTRAGRTSRRHLVEALERLKQAETPVAGTVLTQGGAEAAYGYGYPYMGNGAASRRPWRLPSTRRRTVRR